MARYHHGNLRAALIEAAVELGRESGPAGVGIREAARRTGVSHNAAYRHFADLDDLVAEVASVSLQGLARAMTKRINRVRDKDPRTRALARLQAVGRAYVEYALEEPGLFSVAFASQAHGTPGADGPFEILGKVLDECVEVGAIPQANRPRAEIVCWSAVHGFAMLHLRGPLSESSRRERDLALRTMQARIEDGLAWSRP
ncbi:MAG TPA: TetR/AcrR family transcriptional regulator [Marmoricola sp.]|nr:TetR/AcrR family transcriptional regulator [Marmoricola sp.]